MNPDQPEMHEPESGNQTPVFVIHEPRVASASEGWHWIKAGFRYFMQAPGDWVALCVVGAIIMLAINIVPMGGLLNGMLSQVWIAGIMLGCKAQEDGRKLELKYLFAGFGPKTGQLVLSSLVLLVIEVVLGLIFLGSIILPVLLQGQLNMDTFSDPATLYLIAIKLLILMALLLPVFAAGWFAPLLIVFGNLSIKQALLLSMKACLLNVWSFLVYGLVLLGLLIVAVIPLGLGMLVVGPVMFVSIYVSFKAIFVE